MRRAMERAGLKAAEGVMLARKREASSPVGAE